MSDGGLAEGRPGPGGVPAASGNGRQVAPEDELQLVATLIADAALRLHPDGPGNGSNGDLPTARLLLDRAAQRVTRLALSQRLAARSSEPLLRQLQRLADELGRLAAADVDGRRHLLQEAAVHLDGARRALAESGVVGLAPTPEREPPRTGPFETDLSQSLSSEA